MSKPWFNWMIILLPLTLQLTGCNEKEKSAQRQADAINWALSITEPKQPRKVLFAKETVKHFEIVICVEPGMHSTEHKMLRIKSGHVQWKQAKEICNQFWSPAYWMYNWEENQRNSDLLVWFSMSQYPFDEIGYEPTSWIQIGKWEETNLENKIPLENN